MAREKLDDGLWDRLGCPKVVVFSHLPADPALREYRLGLARRAAQTWKEAHPVTVVDEMAYLCTGYGPDDLEALRADTPAQLVDLGPRGAKWEKMDAVLAGLYLRKDEGRLRGVLFLDDDAVPRPLRADDASKNGLPNVVSLVRNWLRDPTQSSYPLVFFACAGLRFDAFYKAAKGVLVDAPPAVVGWAQFARSDLGVRFDPKMFAGMDVVVDDAYLRWECAARGVPVGKHCRAFFKSLQNLKDDAGSSTVAASVGDRNYAVAELLRRFRQNYPDFPFYRRSRTVHTAGLGIVDPEEKADE